MYWIIFGGVMPNIWKLFKSSLLLLSPFLFACGNEAISSSFSSMETFYNVTLVDNPDFTVDSSTKRIAKGKDARFELTFKEGKDYSSSSYPGSTYISPKGNKGTLVLPCITYPLRVEVNATEVTFSITYFANGGEVKYSEGDSYTISYNPKNHLRSNVSIGNDFLSRKGYVLTGWNDKSDGSGNRVGLGSRVCFTKGENKSLYAVWAKELDEKDFDVWQNEEGKWAINGYHGDKTVESFVVPASISRINVDLIESGSFKDLSCKEVVLPSSIKRVQDKAFLSCAPFDLYIYDSVVSLGEDPFGGSVNRIHVNAALPPYFLDKTYEPCLADRVDYLLLSKEKKRLILFAGCSLAYAVDSPRIERELNGEYSVLDFSITGDTGGLFQFQILESLLGENDTVIHFPEPGSPFQLLANNSVDTRAFMAVEGNWDILEYVNPNDLPDFFPSFAAFNSLKTSGSMVPCSYDDDCFAFDEYGDFNGEPRLEGKEDAVYNAYQYGYELSWANEDSCRLLAEEYRKLLQNGVENVYFAYSPVNYSGLTKEAIASKVWEKYAEVYENEISGMPSFGFKVMGKVEETLFNGKYFFDADYHLNLSGRDLFTDNLLPHLKAELGIKG